MMTRRTAAQFTTFLVACTVSLLLLGCSNPTGLFGRGNAIDKQADARPSLPTYTKGSWYAFNDGSQDVVIDVVGETIVWQDEEGRLETRYRNPALPRLKWPRGETSVLAEPDALWPLAAGNSVLFYEVRNEFDMLRRLTQRKQRVWRCQVQEMTVTDTEAGSFETYPISCVLRSRGGANKLLGTRLWHYAPAVGHYVRREKIDSVGTREIQELIARG